MRHLGVKWLAWSDDKRRLAARIGANMWSWGEWLMATLADAGHVHIESVCRLPTQAIDWGKNARNCRRFLAAVSDRLRTEAG